MAKAIRISAALALGLSTPACVTTANDVGDAAQPVAAAELEGLEIRTIPVSPDLIVEGATYTPSGKVLVNYTRPGADSRDIGLATLNDDGSDFRQFFAGVIPARPQDNGIRYMIFPDNRRIFLGDFILECSDILEECTDPVLIPVDYPAEIASGEHLGHRWSEIVVAPDSRHIAWTTLLANYSALVFTGQLEREEARYVIVEPRIVSTLDPFIPDPAHADGVIPQPVRGGEVKQFVHGGAALSLAGTISRDIPDSVVQHLATGELEAITDTPGYTETTIFSPDETLGIVMTTRFSEPTDPAILGLMPRPYPASLNMGLARFAYSYSILGVRRSRQGNIGPALIDIAASTQGGSDYRGINLNTDPDWVYYSPMSWHPDSRRATWIEGQRTGGSRRVQMVELVNRAPGTPVAMVPTPEEMPYALSDMSVVREYAASAHDIDVKVYGRASGYLTYRRTPTGEVEKTYFDFSDDGDHFYSGSERFRMNLGGRSTYVSDVTLRGPEPGRMDLQVTFGTLGGNAPAAIIFEAGPDGLPLSRGFAEYGGRRLEISDLVP